MCIAFLWQLDGQTYGNFKFILAANRDESFHRPAKPAHFWSDHNHVVGGQDLSKAYPNGYGTWLGMTRCGKLSYLTNFPSALSPQINPKGRGELISDYLKSSQTGREYLNHLQDSKYSFGPFNLVCGNVKDELFYTRNVLENDEDTAVQTIPRGFSYMTNDVLECGWQKAVKGLEFFAEVVRRGDAKNMHDDILAVLSDSTSYHPDPAMRVVDDLNCFKSSVFVPVIDDAVGFGTRTNTVVTVDQEDNVTFVERTKTELHQCPSEWSTTVLRFQIKQ